VNKPKAIGTAAETAVVRALRRLGFPGAERRALTGALDQGDVTGCVGICWEVKGGAAARTASDGQVAEWLAETEKERANAGADIGVLVLQRSGVGAANADRWWAVVTVGTVWACHPWAAGTPTPFVSAAPVRMLLSDVCGLLRLAGYGSRVEEGVA
jgi:hypothetical protein